MAGTASTESVKTFLLRYCIGFVAFFSVPAVIFMLFDHTGEVFVEEGGELHLGPAQTYFETMAMFTPFTFVAFMGLSALAIGLVSWLTFGVGIAIKKAFEAVGVGIGFLLIGMWIYTPAIVSSLENAYREAVDDDYATVEVLDGVMFNSSMLFAIVVVWINFLLESVRLGRNKLPEF